LFFFYPQAKKKRPYLEVAEQIGPITFLEKGCPDEVVEKVAEITVRYSDAPEGVEVDVKRVAEKVKIMKASAANDGEIQQLRLQP
jgi:hypothetical protein